MKYLADVNVLIALAMDTHEFHERVVSWIRRLPSGGGTEILTCALTERGLLRVAAQVPAYSFTVEDGKRVLTQWKHAARVRFRFLADDSEAAMLPAWTKGPRQVTDGHLVALAKRHGAKLATLDKGIPGAFVIPESRV